jgi:CubicO group peptidase (beta-lactamase class C family)
MNLFERERPTDDNWMLATPSQLGFAANLGSNIDDAVIRGQLNGIHGLVVVRAGQIALERYYEGLDFSWGTSHGHVVFGPDSLHDVRSVTKSIVSLLYGIALAAEAVPPPDARLLESFPEYADIPNDERRKCMTVAHALTMTLGTKWNESGVPYSNPLNSEIAMERAPDRWRYALDRPMADEPGARWVYNGGASAILGRLICKGSGQSLPDFARANLFAPLGISGEDWLKGVDGIASAASGLRLTPRHLARIGQMILNDGLWEGRRVVPSDWLNRSFEPAATLEEGRRYGYQWYIDSFPISDESGVRSLRCIYALGNGDQRLYVMPELQMVVALVSGNYDSNDQKKMPLSLMKNFVLAGVRH